MAAHDADGDTDVVTVATHDLNFSYPGIDGRPMPGSTPVVQHMNIQLRPGQRCLLIGANGAGKTTLLKTLAGQHMVPEDSIRILGRPPFHDTKLTASGDLSYLGGNWVRDIAFAGYSIPLQGDFPAAKMVDGLHGVDPARKARLLEVLDVDPTWRMHLVSDGQRRRVQLLLGLLHPFKVSAPGVYGQRRRVQLFLGRLHPFKVLLLDEITVDLDVLGRSDLLAFLRKECEQRGATIVYATHIFDGLESWPTHLMYLARGQVQLFKACANIPELENGRLMRLVEGWLREEAKHKSKATSAADGGKSDAEMVLAEWSNGYAPGRMTSSLKHSSNAVMRM